MCQPRPKHQPSPKRRLRTALLTTLLLLAACDQDAVTSTPVDPPVETPTLASLEIATPTPHELIFSAVQATTSTPQAVTLRNTGTAPLVLHALQVTGPDQAAFVLDAPALPFTIPPGAVSDLALSFSPQVPGTAEAVLELGSSDPRNALVEVGLHGLGSQGEQGDDEPSLQQIVDTLGYAVSVGGHELHLGTEAEAVGDEVMVPMFERAGPGPVTLSVVARYGPEAPFPYGVFSLSGATDAQGNPLERPLRREVGTVAAAQAQMLLPPYEGETLGFSPGNEPFGVYGQAGEGTQYSLDALNGGLEHALRVYPLRDRSGTPVPNSFLLALEEAQNGDYQDAVLVLENVRAAGTEAETEPATETAGGWENLFNGKNLDGWYTYLESEGKDSDPRDVFKVENGVLHLLDVEDTGERDYGYLATQKSYQNYHLRLEYRWGSKRFYPRATEKRDSGVIYHMTGDDRVWPQGVEYQIQEGDTGDFWLLSGTTLETTVRSPDEEEPRYRQFGKPFTSEPGSYIRIVKDGTFNSEKGWNTVDLIVRGDTATHMINGHVNNRAHKLFGKDGDPLSDGKILLEVEGAEVFYRNIQIRPLGGAQ